MNKIALILGHGLHLNEKLAGEKELFLDTPFGKPSGKLRTGKLNGLDVIVLSRHGEDESIEAFQVNYKANLFVLHEIGCSHILASSLCGSLQEEICVGEMVVFDQFIDLTNHREMTFSGTIELDKLNHSAFHKPFSDEIRDALIEASIVKGYTVHTKGTVVAVDGPRQSTRAESNLYRSWKSDVINTTTAPEAILAHELGIKYGAISLCTYYDTWRTDIPPASRGEKLAVIEENADKLQEIVLGSLTKLF